jgi:predicted dehydrogenase
VVLHASALTAAVAPRWAVHGTEGSYVQHGLDPQEDVLKTGAAPGSPGWGVHHTPGVLTLRDGDALRTTAAPMQTGDYRAYYAGLQHALATGAPAPVTAAEALAVMAWIAAGQRSVATGAWATP